jgi:glycosyltransferase involved in cell wall biosynthesis
VFVSASAHEGYCVPVVEAMRFGVPVVARAAGAVPETAGGAAVLVAGAEASRLAVGVHRVVTDEGLAARMSAAGRSRARVLSARERTDYRDALAPMLERLR